jgi:hypothetical protein
MKIIEFEFILYGNNLIVCFWLQSWWKQVRDLFFDLLTFSAAIYQLFGIHIGYTLELTESHFPIRPIGSDHSLVRIRKWTKKFICWIILQKIKQLLLSHLNFKYFHCSFKWSYIFAFEYKKWEFKKKRYLIFYS